MALKDDIQKFLSYRYDTRLLFQFVIKCLISHLTMLKIQWLVFEDDLSLVHLVNRSCCLTSCLQDEALEMLDVRKQHTGPSAAQLVGMLVSLNTPISFGAPI